jgi:hypothetical protein
MPLPRARTFGRTSEKRCARTDRKGRLLQPILDSDHSKSRWRTPMGVPSHSAKSQCRNLMGARPLQQLLPPGGIDTGATPASRMPSPATRPTQTPLPLRWRRCDGWRHGSTATRGLEVGVDMVRLPTLSAHKHSLVGWKGSSPFWRKTGKRNPTSRIAALGAGFYGIGSSFPRPGPLSAGYALTRTRWGILLRHC